MESDESLSNWASVPKVVHDLVSKEVRMKEGRWAPGATKGLDQPKLCCFRS